MALPRALYHILLSEADALKVGSVPAGKEAELQHPNACLDEDTDDCSLDTLASAICPGCSQKALQVYALKNRYQLIFFLEKYGVK